MNNFGEKVLEWYQHNGRFMPWRENRNPYYIWVAEIIFQQTRIAQGLDYYYRFVKRFPNVEELANAPLDEVLKYWEGLGYYSRARNLHTTAQYIVKELDGSFPSHYTELLKLKGIGPYTARAIGSFAFDNPVGVLDGNVLRVMSRMLGDFAPVNDQKTRKRLQSVIDTWVQGLDSRLFNHGMMDLGATVCTPTKPGCLICPLVEECVAYREGIIHLLPQKHKTLERKTRFYHFYLVFDELGQIAIRQRPQKGLWGGLWEIPNQEFEEKYWQNHTLAEQEFCGNMKHVFTHFDMMIKVFKIQPYNFPEAGNYQFISIDKISNFAFSKAVLNIFDAYLLE